MQITARYAEHEQNLQTKPSMENKMPQIPLSSLIHSILSLIMLNQGIKT